MIGILVRVLFAVGLFVLGLRSGQESGVPNEEALL